VSDSGERSYQTRTATTQRPTFAKVDSFTLRIVGGPDKGTSFESDGSRLRIGTHETADFRLSDQASSRFHCEILSGPKGAPVLVDLGSRNGTRLDDVWIERAPLHSGSTISVGDSAILFELGEEPHELPLYDAEEFGLMVGESTAMRSLFYQLERAAATDASVLLLGETGTGKELAAESLHLTSARRDRPFVCVDCASLTPTLIESELFGHRKGSFTGASTDRSGAFVEGDGGTVFLDEIGELPSKLQSHLLRVLERRQVKAIGADHYQDVDVRIVAATNRDLREEVSAGRFRSDLYFRLAVLPVELPALRDRRDDIPKLVVHMASTLSSDPEAAKLFKRHEVLSRLKRYSWPGNVRELRNYVERSLALRRAAPLDGQEQAQSDEPVIDASISYKEAREDWLSSFEIRYLRALLEAHEGNISAAARAAGIDRAYLYRLLWRHKLK